MFITVDLFIYYLTLNGLAYVHKQFAAIRSCHSKIPHFCGLCYIIYHFDISVAVLLYIHWCFVLNACFDHIQRLDALTKFKSNEVDVLLATDLAARGLDISDVKTVRLAGNVLL